MRLAVLVALAAQVAAAGDLPLDLLPANTKVVFGIHVPGIAESALFNDPGTGAKKFSEEWLKFVAITGFDPLRDIDEVLVASAADSEKAAALLVLRGRFDLERMGAGATRYRGIAIVGGGKGGNSVLALMDAATAVAGEIPAVRAAIDRRGHGAALDASLAARVQSLRERFDIWGTGERPEGFVAPTGKRAELDSMDRFEFGVRINQGFALGAELHMRSQQDADKLAASIDALKAMMSGQVQAGPKVDVQVEAGTVKISLAISEADLKRAMAAQRAAAAPVNAGPPRIVSTESAMPAPGIQNGGTTVLVLPGKK